jgi:acyl-CoA synthetase (AMP-forming)/AMP-acid ligase II
MFKKLNFLKKFNFYFYQKRYMQTIETILTRMKNNEHAPAVYWNEQEFSYLNFFEMIDAWTERLPDYGIAKGTVCGVVGDYSPQVCALFFALMKSKAILVPFTRAIEHEIPEFIKIGGVECLFRFDALDKWTFEKCESPTRNSLVTSFLEREVPGLIVFTSGSTGKPKGILHDCEKVMYKFVMERQGWRTVLFLMMDHFGGFNTFLSTFAYGGEGICVPDRTPETVCRVIEQSRATLLPTTPTFLNLLIAYRSYKNFDLSSIQLITYGTEVMPPTILQKLKSIFPNASIKQTYGLSEVGVLRSKSESDNSVWVKIGGDGFEVKVVDNILWVRSEANMVGYLNAPNPFDEDGWLCTGDQIEVRGEYMRILGRKSEVINVGGQKVFPTEVESVLLQADNVSEATVFAGPHPIMGQVVLARVSLYKHEDPIELSERLRKFCLEKIAKYKVPLRFFVVSEDEQRSERFKKIRKT